jgi:hypothetical protein
MKSAILARLSRPKYAFLMLTALSLTVYAIVSLALNYANNPSLLDADEQEYYALAGQLMHGDYTFNLRRPPIHLLVLAFLRHLTFDNLLATHLLVSLVFSLSGPLMYLLARRMTGHNLLAATIGVMTIFWPPFLYYGSTLYSETIVLPLFIITLVLLPQGSVFTVEPKPPGGLLHCFVPGVLLGLCMLVRPMYLLFSPFAVAVLFLEERTWAVATRRSALLAAGCFLIVLPWSTYITLKAGTPILISANGGETLGGGLNPVLIKQGYKTFIAPDGRQTWGGPGKWVAEYDNGYLNEDEQKLPYAKRDVLMRQRTMAWALQNPSSALFLESAKLLYMWGVYPFYRNGVTQALFGNIPTVALIILSILSLVRFRGYRRHLSRFWILPLFVSFVALISWGSWRFRQPGDLGLIMLSGLFLWSIFEEPKHLMGSNLPGPLDPRAGRTDLSVGEENSSKYPVTTNNREQ